MNDSHSAQQWYALHVRSRHEKRVSAQLKAKQHDVFLPLYWARHRWADRWKTVCLPLFQGYVFCRFEGATQPRVLATTGVIDVVRIGAKAAPVETAEIEAIRRVVNSPLPVEPYPSLVAGQKVVMGGGPLNGLSGTLVKIRNGLRLVISVELLRRSVLVEVERQWVVPYGPAGLAHHAPAMLEHEYALRSDNEPRGFPGAIGNADAAA